MPNTARQTPGGMIFHGLNRPNARDRIFDDDAYYDPFEKALEETQPEVFVRMLSNCRMPNHCNLILWSLQDGYLGRFMQRLTTKLVRRWYLHHHSVGTGHLCQGTLSHFPSKRMLISIRSCVMSSGTTYNREWSNGPRIGLGKANGDGCIPQNTWRNRRYAHDQSHDLTTGSGG